MNPKLSWMCQYCSRIDADHALDTLPEIPLLHGTNRPRALLLLALPPQSLYRPPTRPFSFREPWPLRQHWKALQSSQFMSFYILRTFHIALDILAPRLLLPQVLTAMTLISKLRCQLKLSPDCPLTRVWHNSWNRYAFSSGLPYESVSEHFLCRCPLLTMGNIWRILNIHSTTIMEFQQWRHFINHSHSPGNPQVFRDHIGTREDLICFQLNYHLYTLPVPKAEGRKFFISDDIREELLKRSETIHQGPAPGLPLPEEVQGYHSLVPLEMPNTEKRKIMSWSTMTYKAIKTSDGRAYALRRIESMWFQASRSA